MHPSDRGDIGCSLIQERALVRGRRLSMGWIRPRRPSIGLLWRTFGGTTPSPMTMMAVTLKSSTLLNRSGWSGSLIELWNTFGLVPAGALTVGTGAGT